MELLYKQLNIDKNHFQQVIGDFLFGQQCKISFLSLSQKTLMKNLLLLKTTVYLTIHHSAQWKIANFT